MAGKGKQIRLNTTDKNKEQVDFVHKPNQHLIIESRYNLTVGLFILWMDYWMNKRNHFAINESISLLATGTLDLVWLYIFSDMYQVYALYSMYFDTWKRLNFPWYEKTNQQRFQLKSMKFECDWPRAIPSRSTQEPYRCKVHTISSPQIVQGYFYAAR